MLLLTDIEGENQGFKDHMDLSDYIGVSLRGWKIRFCSKLESGNVGC